MKNVRGGMCMSMFTSTCWKKDSTRYKRERESEREGEGAMDTITSTIMSRNRAWNSMSTQKNT